MEKETSRDRKLLELVETAIQAQIEATLKEGGKLDCFIVDSETESPAPLPPEQQKWIAAGISTAAQLAGVKVKVKGTYSRVTFTLQSASDMVAEVLLRRQEFRGFGYKKDDIALAVLKAAVFVEVHDDEARHAPS